MNPPSIRRTLLIRCGIGVGALLCILSVTIYLIVRQSLYREIDASINQTAALLANQVELENDEVLFEWQEGLGTNKAIILDGLFQFWNDTTGETTRSPALLSNDLSRFHGGNGSPLIRNIHLPDGKRGRAVGLRVFPFILPEEIEMMHSRGRAIDPQSLPHTLVVAGNLEPLHRTLDQLGYVLLSGSLLTLAVGFTLIDHVIRITLRPIDELSRQVHERTEQQLDSALELPDALPAELAGLAGNFDSLLTRVAAIRLRERDFIRHAAHELRTPIAGLSATTELALSKPRDSAGYREHLASCQKTAMELGELVSRLSALSRVGQSAAPAVMKCLDAKVFLMECLERFAPLLEQRGIGLAIGIPDNRLMVRGDATLLRIILNNLLDNALSYARSPSEVRIRAELAAGKVEFRLSNMTKGTIGNPERLFEPLFREDISRSDAGAHLGIGLTLARNAAGSMGTSLVARLPGENWIEFVFSMPTAETPPVA
jgi:signal transduction histidine kinase